MMMKTNELKEIARENGYEFSFDYYNILLKKEVKYLGTTFKTIIRISRFSGNSVLIICSGYTDDGDINMIEASIAYAKTPLGDREELSKFYLKHRFLYPDSYECFLNYSLYNDDLVLASKNGSAYYKTQFTQKEIDEIKEKYDTDLKDFEQIEVEE